MGRPAYDVVGFVVADGKTAAMLVAEESVPLTAEEIEIQEFVNTLSVGDLLALKADLAEANGSLEGTDVTDMSEEELIKFLDQF